MAEISSGGGENLPGGGEKNLAAPPSPQAQRFFAFLHTITNLRPLFYIFDSCYKEIHKIYIFFILFLVRLLYFIRKFDSLNVLGSGGSKPL